MNASSGADLRQLLAPASRAGDQLELAPAGPGPLMAGQPPLELPAQPRRVVGVPLGLERVLRPVVAEHLEVKRAADSLDADDPDAPMVPVINVVPFDVNDVDLELEDREGLPDSEEDED